MADPFLLFDSGVPRWTIDTHHIGKVLDITAAKPDDGTPVQQWQWNGQPNQLFYLLPLADKQWLIAASHSGRVLDVAGDGGPGSRVVQWPFHGKANQRWKFVPTKDHFGYFQNVSKGLVMDIMHGSTDDGGWLIVYDKHGAGFQHFRPYVRNPDGSPAAFLD